MKGDIAMAVDVCLVKKSDPTKVSLVRLTWLPERADVLYIPDASVLQGSALEGPIDEESRVGIMIVDKMTRGFYFNGEYKTFHYKPALA